MFFEYISLFIGNFLFQGFLDDNEKILYIAHRHIWIYYKYFLKKAFLGLFVPFFVWYLFPVAYPAMLVWIILGLLILVHQTFDWYFDSILITNASIKVIEWNGFFDSSASTIEYEKIEGVSWSKKGFAQTILGFGDVTIEKIGSGTPLILKDASSPKTIEKQILKQQNQIVEQSSLKNYDTLHGLISDMILQHQARKK